MQDIIRIGLVEDQHLFREGIKAIISARSDFEVVFEAENGYSVIDRLQACEVLPHVMLVDLTLPANGSEEYSGRRVIQALLEYFPDIRSIVLSAHNDSYLIAQLIEQGANGYLLKDCDPEEVYEAIGSVHNKGSYINENTLKAIQSRLSGKVRQPMVHEALTKRELEVLRLVCQQMTAEEIGNELFISTKTVNGHRNHLLQKTGSKNVTGLVMYAVKHRLVDFV